MTENIEEENTEPEHPSIIGGCILLGLILIIVWGIISCMSDKISEAEIDSLVGLSTSELRQKLGKPDDVRLKEGASLTPRSPGSTKVKPDESWIYFSKVNHKASGTTMSLSCDVQDGKCVAAKVR